MSHILSVTPFDVFLCYFLLCSFTREIVEDLPTVYELPKESVDYINDMIHYTVAGGKMNRGLSCMSVQQTFCKFQKNRDLNDAVRLFLLIKYCCVVEMRLALH